MTKPSAPSPITTDLTSPQPPSDAAGPSGLPSGAGPARSGPPAPDPTDDTAGTTTPDILHRTSIDSPVGELTLVASDAGLRAVLWENDHGTDRVRYGQAVDDPDHPVLVSAASQITEYFTGRRRRFDLPLDPEGTEFQKAVWLGLADIAYGETATYGEQAARLGDPRKARAVGAANGKNPLSIVLPCHRVIGSDGSLTGFAGGLAAKRLLLDLEQGVRPLL